MEPFMPTTGAHYQRETSVFRKVLLSSLPAQDSDLHCGPNALPGFSGPTTQASEAFPLMHRLLV